MEEERVPQLALYEQAIDPHRGRLQAITQHVPATMREHDEGAARQRDRGALFLELYPGVPLIQDVEVRQAAGWQGHGPGRRQLGAAEDPALDAQRAQHLRQDVGAVHFEDEGHINSPPGQDGRTHSQEYWRFFILNFSDIILAGGQGWNGLRPGAI